MLSNRLLFEADMVVVVILLVLAILLVKGWFHWSLWFWGTRVILIINTIIAPFPRDQTTPPLALALGQWPVKHLIFEGQRFDHWSEVALLEFRGEKVVVIYSKNNNFWKPKCSICEVCLFFIAQDFNICHSLLRYKLSKLYSIQAQPFHPASVVWKKEFWREIQFIFFTSEQTHWT